MGWQRTSQQHHIRGCDMDNMVHASRRFLVPRPRMCHSHQPGDSPITRAHLMWLFVRAWQGTPQNLALSPHQGSIREEVWLLPALSFNPLQPHTITIPPQSTPLSPDAGWQRRHSQTHLRGAQQSYKRLQAQAALMDVAFTSKAKPLPQRTPQPWDPIHRDRVLHPVHAAVPTAGKVLVPPAQRWLSVHCRHCGGSSSTSGSPADCPVISAPHNGGFLLSSSHTGSESMHPCVHPCAGLAPDAPALRCHWHCRQ